MRKGPLFLLFAVLFSFTTQAEEAPAEPITAPPLAAATAAETQVDELEQRLAESERQRAELSSQLEKTAKARESAQFAALRQENQRLKQQLQAALAGAGPLLNEQQRWFLIGAGVSLSSLLIGALLRGRRRSRREWIN